MNCFLQIQIYQLSGKGLTLALFYVLSQGTVLGKLSSGAYYQPDIVLYKKKTDKIKAIIEVEQGTRKHVIGGIITADYCMGKKKQKPLMLVLALTQQDQKDYKKRLKLLKNYVRNIKIAIGGEKEIMKLLKKM